MSRAHAHKNAAAVSSPRSTEGQAWDEVRARIRQRFHSGPVWPQFRADVACKCSGKQTVLGGP